MAETKKLLTAFFEPSRSIPLFIVGTAALSLALQAAYDFANEPNEFKGGYWLAIGCLAVAAAILSISAIRQRYAVGQISMKQEKSPRRQMGLILLADAAGENARDAIEYCLPTLKHCWIIAARDSLETAQALAEQYRDQIASIYYGELNYLVDPDQLQATYDVEAAKILARQMVTAYMETGAPPPGQTAPVTPGALQDFLAHSQPGDYAAIHAYVHPTAATDAALLKLRTHLRDHYKLATTVGYGPRFLHSTGQLHKGDGGNGLFIQFIGRTNGDAPIPDEAGQAESSMSFGVLKQAQALGDAQALHETGRRVIRFDLGRDVSGSLQKLTG